MTKSLDFKKLLALALAVGLPAAALAEKGPGRFSDALASKKAAVSADRLDDTLSGTWHDGTRVKPEGAVRPVSTVTPGHLAQRAEASALRVLNMTFLTGQSANDSAFGGQAVASHLSLRPTLSGNGNFVAFTSLAGNLVAGDTNGMGDVFRYDIGSGTIEMASPGDNEGSSGIETFLDGSGRHFQLWVNSLSDDGNLVCYTSDSAHSAFHAGDQNNLPDVYVRNMTGGTYTRVSVDSGGIEGTDGRSIDGVIAGDGSAVAYASLNTFGNPNDQNSFANVDTGASDGGFDVFWKDTSTLSPNADQVSSNVMVSAEFGTTDSTSVNMITGAEATTLAQRPWISGDGQLVVYDSNNPRITSGAGVSGVLHHVYMWNATSGTNTLVSTNSDGSANNGAGQSATTPISSFNPHISSNGQWVTFTSNLDLLGTLGGNGAPQIYVRDLSDPASIRIANALSDGTRVSPAFFRGGSPTVDNNGNVTFVSGGDIGASDNNGLTDVYYKAYDAAPPAATGTLLRVSAAPGGPENSKGISSYGNAFFDGAHDRAWHDPAGSHFVFSHEAPELDTSGPGTFNLRNIFVADHDASPAITGITKATQGDPTIDATIALDESVTANHYGRRGAAGQGGGVVQAPSISANGQWMAFTGHARSMVDLDGDFDEDLEAFVSVVNLVSGQVIMGSRDINGAYMENSFFGFGDEQSATFGDIIFDDIFPRFGGGLQVWGAGVNNAGGYAFYTLNDFGDGAGSGPGQVLWAATSTSPVQQLTNEINGGPIGVLNGGVFFASLSNDVDFTPNGRYFFFNSDSVNVASGFANNIGGAGIGVTEGYRYDTMADDIILASVRRDGSNPDGETFVINTSNDGNRCLIFNVDANLGANIGTFTSQINRLWMRDFTAPANSQVFLVEANATGAAAATTDAGIDVNSTMGTGADLSGDGTKVVFESNADNMVAGVTGQDGLQVYLKTLDGGIGGVGGFASTGPVTLLSANNTSGMGVDVSVGEFAQDAAMSNDGNVYVFTSNATLTGAADPDNNPATMTQAGFDIFYRAADSFGGQGGGTGSVLLASKNASDEQFTVPASATVDRPTAYTNGNFAFVIFETDSASATEDIGGSPHIAGAASSASAYWIASFTGGMTAADDSWALFE